MPAGLLDSVDSLEHSLQRERGAWAAWRDHAVKARFSAVMGTSLSRNLRPSASWDIRGAVTSNDELSHALWGTTGCQTSYDNLQTLICEHLGWCLTEAEAGIVAGIREGVDPDFSLFDSRSQSEGLAKAEQEREETIALIEAKLAEVRSEAEAFESSRATVGMAGSRHRVQKLHSDQLTFIKGKAGELAFADRAALEISSGIAALKANWTERASLLFSSTVYIAAAKERRLIDTEKASIEVQLQDYFDHQGQSSTHSETAKPDKQSLKITPDLQKKSEGFRQIQLIDMYCVCRGNEMWSIIPDILRIGHDVDPITCMHWKPPITGDALIDPNLAEYRRDQNRQFAKRLLNACVNAQGGQGLRTMLLARHEFGVNKLEFKADEHDGCSLYWVMLQLFYPLNRDHRRKLEAEIAAMPKQLAGGSNPKQVIEDIQGKLQEALDIMLRLSWDTIGVPIIDHLSSRDPLYAYEFTKYRDTVRDPDDSGIEIDEVLC